LPQAIATGCIHIGTIAGKLNGVIPAQTPSGWRKDQASTPEETWSEYSPFSSCGIPQANSTTSSPRSTSPFASSSTLPCSEETIRASSSTLRSSSSRKANMTLARRLREASDQSTKASRAAATATSTSAGSASTTSACGPPVAGSQTGAVREEAPLVSSPPIRCRIVRFAVTALTDSL